LPISGCVDQSGDQSVVGRDVPMVQGQHVAQHGDLQSVLEHFARLRPERLQLLRMTDLPERQRHCDIAHGVLTDPMTAVFTSVTGLLPRFAAAQFA
jgi:hypothetical protein